MLDGVSVLVHDQENLCGCEGVRAAIGDADGIGGIHAGDGGVVDLDWNVVGAHFGGDLVEFVNEGFEGSHGLVGDWLDLVGTLVWKV